MTDLSDKTKFRLIVRNHERTRAYSDGDSTLSPKTQAAKACRFSRTFAHYVEKGHPIKNAKKRDHFEQLFRREIAAEVGSDAYRQRWAEVRAVVEGQFARPLISEFLVSAAYGHWAAIALDDGQPDAERLLAGRKAEYVLYHFSRKETNGRSAVFIFEIEKAVAEERGREVIACLARILASNPTPPPGLFDHGSEAAQELGYRIFRNRLFSDHTGWQATALAEDNKRAQHFAEAYKAGLATDLMSLHEELEHSDVAYPNNAFVLAIHAGDWPRAAEYGVALLKAFPDLLTGKVGGLTALLDDYTVSPGVAAMMEHRLLEIPTALRGVLKAPDAKHITAMGRIRQMMPGVKAGDPYLSVLKMGE